ncbi:hypothetical protein OVY35_24550, partial [Salmonella enterica subsp. enterica serovar 1,4,[5],12:i:-]|nr:hypothetical protein [Salmonella enterica subsp. enterica serovar 1,4,[5],12:i:-]
YVYLRLLSRKTPQYNKVETRMWDVGGDAFDSMLEAGILEIANQKSLDEPELESLYLLVVMVLMYMIYKQTMMKSWIFCSY